MTDPKTVIQEDSYQCVDCSLKLGVGYKPLKSQRTDIRSWEPLKNSKGVNAGPVEVEFSSANSPDRPLFVCVAGGTLFQKSEVLASL